jgi:hypothetical protein
MAVHDLLRRPRMMKPGCLVEQVPATLAAVKAGIGQPHAGTADPTQRDLPTGAVCDPPSLQGEIGSVRHQNMD